MTMRKCFSTAVLLLAGCGDDISPLAGADPGGAPGAGGSGASIASAGSDAGGAGGAAPECTTPANCDTLGDCVQPVCLGGECGTTFTPNGTPTGEQRAGDCNEVVCDGSGASLDVDDDLDVPNDGNDCTIDACTDGVASNEPSPVDTPCGDGLACDGAGACVGCIDASECGESTDCIAFNCNGGVCGSTTTAAGSALSAQTPGDCLIAVCDGAGGTTTDVDDGDLPIDGNECTGDACSNGTASNPPEPDGVPCAGGGSCDGAGVCVIATCADSAENGQETDEDCGGPTCPPCATGLGCSVGADCVSGSCSGGTCQPTCTDGEQNQGESDVDCGGPCLACPVGNGCSDDVDCMSGSCNGVCEEYRLLISEARARGPGAGTDDFIELYNPLDVDVLMPPASGAPVQIATRSDAAGSYTIRHTFDGETIGAHRHFLLAGSGYTGAAVPDVQSGAGLITDKVSIVVRRDLVTIDAFCMYFATNHSCALEKSGQMIKQAFIEAKTITDGRM